MKNNDSMYNIFDFSDSVPLGAAKIELNSNRQVIIDGCLGVIDYSENAINLNCGKKNVLFVGSGLEIVSYIDKDLILEGNIDSIEFGGR